MNEKDRINNIYTDYYKNRASLEKWSNEKLSNQLIEKERFQAIKDLFCFYSINLMDKMVIDIGCAGGAFPKAADDLGFNVVGIEPSKYLCEWGKKEYGLDLRPGILDEHDFEKESFDVITLWDVVEHLIDPRVEIKKISNILFQISRNWPNTKHFVGNSQKSIAQKSLAYTQMPI